MKNMTATDHELLSRFLKAGDQVSFTELVRRHLGLVHSAALRITNQPTLSEEVSQLVFTKLARLRSPLKADLSLVTWLHRTTRSTAIDLVRSEVRRRKREDAAASLAMNQSTIPWEEISPVLDEVIDKLAPDDRHLVLCRYFEGQSHAELARSLGLSEDAVRMRVNRSLEKIRTLLQKRGITTTASALSAALPAHALIAVPAGLSSTVVSAAVASLTPTLSIVTIGIITMTKKTAITTAVVLLAAGAGTAVYIASGSAENSTPSASVLKISADLATESTDSSNLIRSKSRDRQPAKELSDAESNLVSQYGDSRVKLAKRITASMIGFLGQDGLVGVASMIEGESKKQNMEELSTKLALTEAQQKQAEEIYAAAKAGKNQELTTMVQYLKDNSTLFTEVLLAGDAFKRNKITKADYDAISSRLDPAKSNVESAMNLNVGGASGLWSEEAFINELKPLLDPSQIQLLEEEIINTPPVQEDEESGSAQVTANFDEPETLETLDEQVQSASTMINGIKTMMEGMKGLQNLNGGTE